MKAILNQLFEHQKLSADQAKEVLKNIADGAYNEAQVAAFISVYLMRSISVDELKGFREALLDLCIKVDVGERQTIDVCGTGGDGKNTFNISTLSAFVIAGAGYQVTKHGNYGVSSLCGSSNVLEHLGLKFHNNVEGLIGQLDECNICFLHAPLFHPAMKSVGPIRRQLGVKTFFNMLGPLVNPARPTHQMVGVFNLQLARMYKYLMEDSDTQYSILHAIDGYDEISLTGSVKVISKEEELLVTPSYFSKSRYKPEEIFGGESIDEAAQIFLNVLQNNGKQAQKDVVVANAGVGIKLFNPEASMAACILEAETSIDSGKAYKCLQSSIKISQNY